MSQSALTRSQCSSCQRRTPASDFANGPSNRSSPLPAPPRIHDPTLLLWVTCRVALSAGRGTTRTTVDPTMAHDKVTRTLLPDPRRAVVGCPRSRRSRVGPGPLHRFGTPESSHLLPLAGCLVCLACSLGSPRPHLTAVHIMDTIGRYQILRKMGWGHFSTVWLAKDTQCVSTV